MLPQLCVFFLSASNRYLHSSTYDVFFADHISWYAVTEFLGILLEWYPNFPSSPVQITYFNYICIPCMSWDDPPCSMPVESVKSFSSGVPRSPLRMSKLSSYVRMIDLPEVGFHSHPQGTPKAVCRQFHATYGTRCIPKVVFLLFLKLCLDGPKTPHAKKIVP